MSMSQAKKKTKDVGAMAQELQAYMDTTVDWAQDTDGARVKKIHGVLDALIMLPDITVEVLQTTRIGKILNKLSKHQDQNIQGYSKSLIRDWKKKLVGSPKASFTSSSLARPRKKSLDDNPPENKFALAREKLKKNYQAAEDAKKSRNIVLLNSSPPMNNKSKKNLLVTKGFQRPSGALSNSAFSRSQSTSPPKRTMTSTMLQKQKRLDQHLRRQAVLRQRAAATLQKYGTVDDNEKRGMSKSSDKSHSNLKSDSSKHGLGPKSVNTDSSRKQMLNTLYFRAKEPSLETSTTSTISLKTKVADTKLIAISPQSQREVVDFFKGLLVDMSVYAPNFIDMGFDSKKMLTTVTNEDIKEIISKKAHQRIVMEGIQKLKNPSSREKSAIIARDRKRSRSETKDYDLASEDDSFIDDDEGDEEDIGYAPGIITNMILGKKKPHLTHRFADYDNESSDMEATYDEVRFEEARSAYIGRKEDAKEDIRLRKHKELVNERKAKRSRRD